MSFAATALLGAIAGSTIFLGLPLARASALTTRARVGLSMLSAGILAFLEGGPSLIFRQAKHSEQIPRQRKFSEAVQAEQFRRYTEDDRRKRGRSDTRKLL